jgi:polar amino acid transport system substrate-binding protein
MRRWGVLLAVIATLGVAACGSSSKNSASSTTSTTAGGATTTVAGAKACATASDAYDHTVGTASDFKPVTAGQLTVVTSLPGPGFWEGSDSDPTKLTSGYEYDIAHAMASAFGLNKVVVRNVSFDAIVAGTVTNYDVALSQISITCDRAKVVRFSMPYFQSNQGILVNKGTAVPDVAAAKKLHYGVQTSTTAIDLLNKLGPGISQKVFQQLPDAYTALQAHQVDAVLIDTAINLGEAARSNGKFEVVAQFAQPGGPDQYGAILPKASTNAGAVNAVLQQLTTSGQLKQFAEKDLTADPGTIPTFNVG